MGSDGFWDEVSIQEISVLLKTSGALSETELAELLIEVAYRNVTVKRRFDVKKIKQGERRQYIDDLTVVVMRVP